MRSIVLVGLVSLTGLMISALPIAAQRVSGEIVVVRGPVAGRIEVGERPVSQRPRGEVIVVERCHPPRGRARDWWRDEGYRRTIVWVDTYGRYYDRDDERDYGRGFDRKHGRGHDRAREYDRDRDDRRDLRPVNVYQRDGQHYDWDD